MLKRVDNAVYDSFAAGEDVPTGLEVWGIENDGVDYALDEYNADLITDEMRAAVDEAAADIASGDLEVHNYTSDESCPAVTF